MLHAPLTTDNLPLFFCPSLAGVPPKRLLPIVLISLFLTPSLTDLRKVSLHPFLCHIFTNYRFTNYSTKLLRTVKDLKPRARTRGGQHAHARPGHPQLPGVKGMYDAGAYRLYCSTPWALPLCPNEHGSQAMHKPGSMTSCMYRALQGTRSVLCLAVLCCAALLSLTTAPPPLRWTPAPAPPSQASPAAPRTAPAPTCSQRC